MGHKVNPKSYRLKINETWKSRWFANRKYADNLIGDIKIRKMIYEKMGKSFILDVIIRRQPGQIILDIYSARPGLIIGRGGAGIERIKKMVESICQQKAKINILETKQPDLQANYIVQNAAFQIEKRIPFRRVIKQAVEKAKDAGAKGIKVQVAGRLNGADIARVEKAVYGSIPMSTLKCSIDYAYTKALTTYGDIGIKAWVYKGVIGKSYEIGGDKENQEK